MVRTLLNRAETHVSDPEDKLKEVAHVKKVLKANGYQDWALNIPNSLAPNQAEPSEGSTTKKQPPIALPYVQGLSEELHRIYKNHGVNTYHKPTNTLKSLLVHPKDKTTKEKKCGVVYDMPCNQCNATYVGETERSLGTRFKEHLKHENSAVFEHLQATGHSVSFEDVRIIDSEARFNARKIREALHIYKRKPTLNRDQGLEIPPIMLRLLNPTTARDPPDPHDTGGRATGVSTRFRANSM